ncbi:MAG TPA: signal recognition particle-docking protein FtsY [Desulfobacteraceae bacterium]|nr:signal recognition particle-docking protein FtsY [Desulfobacteraceae bacterium]
MWKLFKKRETEEESRGLFQRLKDRLSKTRKNISSRLELLLRGREKIDDELLDELEEMLITADFGLDATEKIIDYLKRDVSSKKIRDINEIKVKIKDIVYGFLKTPERAEIGDLPVPYVILIIGVNGTGKTTTISKLAHMFKQEGRSVLLVAADTFRAAAIEQLCIWADRVGVEVVSQREGSDPSAVVYDGLSSAISRNMDVVLIDTAGRLHTRKDLMEELKKICRVAGKRLPGAPHDIWMVLDATTGQNALSQAEMFNSALGISGIILTKLDGTAKGGIVVPIAYKTKIPVRFIGIGEGMEDLRPFDPKQFVDAIFE